MFNHVFDSLIDMLVMSLGTRQFAALLVLLAISIIFQGLTATVLRRGHQVRKVNRALVLFGTLLLLSSLLGRTAVEGLWGLEQDTVMSSADQGAFPCSSITIVVQSTDLEVMPMQRAPAASTCSSSDLHDRR